MTTRWIALFAALLGVSAAAQTAETVAIAKYIASDLELNADPNSELWKGAPSIVAVNDARGNLTAGHKTEIRQRWSDTHLYILFIAPYEKLHLRAGAETVRETNKLWEWDVAEVFIGGDFQNIHQYREYQVSPQKEWVDLDIDTKKAKPEGGWLWNSGFTVDARIDEKAKVWYGAMKIPFASIDARKPAPGTEYRVNYYRIQGPGEWGSRKFIAWRKTGGNHHIPEAFGLLRLEK